MAREVVVEAPRARPSPLAEREAASDEPDEPPERLPLPAMLVDRYAAEPDFRAVFTEPSWTRSHPTEADVRTLEDFLQRTEYELLVLQLDAFQVVQEEVERRRSEGNFVRLPAGSREPLDLRLYGGAEDLVVPSADSEGTSLFVIRRREVPRYEELLEKRRQAQERIREELLDLLEALASE